MSLVFIYNSVAKLAEHVSAHCNFSKKKKQKYPAKHSQGMKLLKQDQDLRERNINLLSSRSFRLPIHFLRAL